MALAGLPGRVVVVTGGAAGIGAAVVERLLAEGCSVAAVDLDAAGLAAVASSAPADRLLTVEADVSSTEDAERYFEAALERFGRIDGLHANAGIAPSGATLAETEPADFDRIVAVNLRGVFLALRRMLRTAEERRTRASIVTTSSVLGVRGWAAAGPYAATKAAVISLTKTAAIEAGRSGHRVNAILPGPIETPMVARSRDARPPAERESFVRDMVAPVPLARLGAPAEVAALVAWLLSDESSYVTGGVYEIDGGQGAS